ncbi:prephenate dehydrogenase [Candidatus Micrarchaeota archaeon]|nr:prephenate dehydrogenase [Candidatus Micrarchaeota archaeon]
MKGEETFSMKIGIIGFGALGKIAAKHLNKKFEVAVNDSRPDAAQEAAEAGVEFVSLGDACKSDVVLLCVPSSAMETVLLQIAQLVKPGALVVDACSVKVLPCRLMERILPSEVEVIGAHPLFGPQSASEGLDGLRVVLCAVRTTRLEEVKNSLLAIGLQPLVMSAEEHDREMARTQAIAHFALKAMARIIPEKPAVRLRSVQKILEAIGMVNDDSLDLFNDMQNLNLFAKTERKRFLRELGKIESELE